jgi:HAD superfamily hydrolase (TIGR01509 family)
MRMLPPAMKAFIFDVDGTLLDTNTSHVNAWHRTLLAKGYEIPLDRIAPEIGKGGDKLVPAILGDEVEQRDGEKIRALQKEEFLAIAKRTKFVVFDGVRELLAELRRRKVKTCIATSSSREHFDAMMKQADLDVSKEVGDVVTKQGGMESKPAPDLIEAAVEKLGVPASECVMIGDTPHDGTASRKAGVKFVGVLCGGNARKTLEEAGAIQVFRTPKELLQNLNALLS